MSATQKAQLLFRHKRYKECLDALYEVLNEDPENDYAHYLAAYCHMRSLDYDSAHREADLALSINSQDPKHHLLKAQIYYTIDKNRRAREWITSGMAVDPEHHQLYRYSALLYLEAEEYEKAFVEVERGLELYADQPDLLKIRSKINSALGEYRMAERDLDQTLRQNPNDSDAIGERAFLMLNSEKLAEAERLFEEWIRLDPENLDAKRGLITTKAYRTGLWRIFLERGYSYRELPQLDPINIAWGIVMIWFAPIYLTLVVISHFGYWYSRVLFESSLRLNAKSAHLLNEVQTLRSNNVLSLSIIAIVWIVLGIIGFDLPRFWTVLGTIVMCIPPIIMFYQSLDDRGTFLAQVWFWTGLVLSASYLLVHAPELRWSLVGFHLLMGLPFVYRLNKT